MPTAQLREKLAALGITRQSDSPSIATLVGADTHQQMASLGTLFQTQSANPAK